jgi:hypothetical protein
LSPRPLAAAWPKEQFSLPRGPRHRRLAADAAAHESGGLRRAVRGGSVHEQPLATAGDNRRKNVAIDQHPRARHHRDEILISAPIQTIWDIQTDAAGRPSSQPDVGGAEADRPLTVGSVFRWQTAGLDITSTVEEVEAPVGSCGAVPRARDRRRSRLDPRRTRRRGSRPNGRVVGGRSCLPSETLQAALDGSLRAWLENLKRTAERRAGG